MWTMRQIIQMVLLLMEGMRQLLRTARDFAALETGIVELSQQAARQLRTAALEHLDDTLCAERGEGIRIVSTVERQLTTRVGPLTFRRRYVQDRTTGRRYYPLDTALGLAPRERLSPGVQALVVQAVQETSYHGAARLLRAWIPSLTAMACWHVVQRVGARIQAQQASHRATVWEHGEAPTGARRVDTLHVEADGVWVHSRQGGGHEVKLAVAYEGKAAVDRNRRALVGRQVYAGVEAGSTFWETAAARWGQIWAWEAVQTTHLGSDGATWCQEGHAYLPGTVQHHLDPFPLRRALRTACGHDPKRLAQVTEGIGQRDGAVVDQALTAAIRASRGRVREALRALRRYLEPHGAGITAPDAPSLGSIEGAGYHRVARRLKGRAARWSRAGSDHLVRLLAAEANGELAQALAVGRLQSDGPAPRPALPRIRREAGDTDPTWLQAHLPALDGPHAGRPWIRLVLRELAGLIAS
ncbi:MAG: ISLre2 family transposase [Firmicutes bacterium]|nr:ISLre2 family transposase [Bacillota bacterium]